ncbi:MAG: hypothetical protein DMF91_03210, partial [Acidobacteria bacterium]
NVSIFASRQRNSPWSSANPRIHSFVRCRDAFGYHKRKLMLFVEAHSAFGLALHQATRIVRRS